MSNIVDDKWSAYLGKATSAHRATVDMEADHLRVLTGLDTYDRGQLWSTYLNQQGVAPGQLNGRISEFLTGLGYTQKQFSDQLAAFWAAGAPFPV